MGVLQLQGKAAAQSWSTREGERDGRGAFGYGAGMSESPQQITARERMPLAEFLAWEDAQPVRHERVGGHVWAMFGGTLNHNRIAGNVWAALRQRLHGKGCEAFAMDVRVVSPRGDVMYPDVVVACGERRGSDREISDPVIVVEVASPSTTVRDQGYKRWAYFGIPSLRHYVLLEQDRTVAEVATADGEGWRSVFLLDPAASWRLDALGFEIPLAEVFAGVEQAASGPAASEG